MLGFAPGARFAAHLYIVPFLFCTICSLPGSAQFTADQTKNETFALTPSLHRALAEPIVKTDVCPRLISYVENMTVGTCGTIGPQCFDATVVTGVNTSGTVAVNYLLDFGVFLTLAIIGIKNRFTAATMTYI